MRRQIWALLDLFNWIADGAAHLTGQGERKLAQQLSIFLKATDQFMVAVARSEIRGILHGGGDAVEGLGAMRRIFARQLVGVRQGVARELDPRLQERIERVLDRTQLADDVSDNVLAVVAYSALILPHPVCDAHFEHLRRSGLEGAFTQQIRELRRAKQEAFDESIDRMAAMIRKSGAEMRTRLAGDALENTAILTALVAALAQRAKG